MLSTKWSQAAARGMALAVAVFALAAIGAIVAGSLMTGVLEQQSGNSTVYLAQAAEAGEAELWSLLGTIETGTLLALPIGGAPLALGSTVPVGGIMAERQVSRLGENLFLIRVRGLRIDAGGGMLASRAAGLLVRVVPDSLSGAELLAPVHRGWLQLY
jgi:hypothetical protein